MEARFAEFCRKSWLELSGIESVEKDLNLNFPKLTSCEEDIFIGFFFDGTNNNKYRDTPTFASGNVARLTGGVPAILAPQLGKVAHLLMRIQLTGNPLGNQYHKVEL